MRGWVKRGNLSPRRACYRKPALRQNRRLIRKCRQHKGKGPAQGHDPPCRRAPQKAGPHKGLFPTPAGGRQQGQPVGRPFRPAPCREGLTIWGVCTALARRQPGPRTYWRTSKLENPHRTATPLRRARRGNRVAQLERPSGPLPYACWRATSSEKTPPLAMSSS